jgi:hypothetical protein
LERLEFFKKEIFQYDSKLLEKNTREGTKHDKIGNQVLNDRVTTFLTVTTLLVIFKAHYHALIPDTALIPGVTTPS